MDGGDPVSEELLALISDRQQITFNELSDIYFSRGIAKGDLEKALRNLEGKDAIASRSTGGILTYYVLESNPFKRVLIVEDDKNINKLMALSIGSEFEIDQIYDGKDAMTAVRQDRPDLIILDLMLPHKDGLDICQTIKTDPALKNTVVIIVSAMDPASNRFKGIKFGADYYIKKPFDPKELRALVTIFLKKRGKRFDPLVDLPDEERLSKEFERSVKEGDSYSIGTLKVLNLTYYIGKFGDRFDFAVVLRLVSQILQDIVKKNGGGIFAGFLNSDEFVIAGSRSVVTGAVGEVKNEFAVVLPFIMQDLGYKPVSEIEGMFESEEMPKLAIEFTESKKRDRVAKREEVLKGRGKSDDIGAYTYDELQRMLGSGPLNVIISRDSSGVRLRVGKGPLGE